MKTTPAPPEWLGRLAEVLAIFLAPVLGGALFGVGAIAADWKPDRHVEVVVPTGPGSGVDNTARTLQAILQTRKLKIVVFSSSGDAMAAGAAEEPVGGR